MVIPCFFADTHPFCSFIASSTSVFGVGIWLCSVDTHPFSSFLVYSADWRKHKSWRTPIFFWNGGWWAVKQGLHLPWIGNPDPCLHWKSGWRRQIALLRAPFWMFFAEKNRHKWQPKGGGRDSFVASTMTKRISTGRKTSRKGAWNAENNNFHHDKWAFLGLQ